MFLVEHVYHLTLSLTTLLCKKNSRKYGMPKRKKTDVLAQGTPVPKMHLTEADYHRIAATLTVEAQRELVERVTIPTQVREARQVRAILRAMLSGKNEKLVSDLDTLLSCLCDWHDHCEQEGAMNPRITEAIRTGLFAKERGIIETRLDTAWTTLLVHGRNT
jgi:hypothetical protein